MNLSEHTLDINIRRCNFEKFTFSEIDDYVQALTGSRSYQYEAIKQLMIYLWGGAYKSITDLAMENYRKKSQIQHRFGGNDLFLGHIPLPDRLSGVVHMATGTGKSYVIFAIAYLSLVMGLTKRVLVLGPSSTIIEQGLREKIKELMQRKDLNDKLPIKYQGKAINLLNDNDPIEDDSIVVENINAVYTFGSIQDTLFNDIDEVLVLGDEIHHAYSHLKFSKNQLILDKEETTEGKLTDAKSERLWMQFLKNNKEITRHIGFTGTPYNQNEYFADIIYNYSIKDATEQRYIKEINNHVRTETDEGDTPLSLDQRFEMVVKNHLENREKYAYRDSKGKRRVKPITIFICPSQNIAQARSEEFIRFLSRYEKESNGLIGTDSEISDQMRKKVICVVSRVSASEYKEELDHIEEINPNKKGGLVEYVFAVNKLSEGWDVDNVFQIVPMEERVFNSKLLISQVLGRGLRLPRKVPYGKIVSTYPYLTVTNHDKFADHIKEMVDSVTQSDMYLSSTPLPETKEGRGRHHFALFNLNYIATPKLVEAEKQEDAQSPGRLLLKPFDEDLGVHVVRRKDEKNYQLKRNFQTIDEVVYDIHTRFKLRTFESLQFDFGEVNVTDRYPDEEDIKKTIIGAMQEAGIEGEKLSDENRKQIDIYFNQFLPRSKKKRVFENIEGNTFSVATITIEKSSVQLSGLDRDTTAFLSEDYEKELGENNKTVLEHLAGWRGGNSDDKQMLLFKPDLFVQTHSDIIRTYVKGDTRSPYVVNVSKFKNPQNLVLVSHSPEKEFVFLLIENSGFIDSWIKSPDKDFYSLDYEYWKGGKDRTRRSFNPDFFIKIDIENYIAKLDPKGHENNLEYFRTLLDEGIETIIKVVEIKDDDDQDEATPAKSEYAISHFETLNKKLRSINVGDINLQFRDQANQLYTFDLLTPKDYPQWFKKITKGSMGNRSKPSEYHEVMEKLDEDWGKNSITHKTLGDLLRKAKEQQLEIFSIDDFVDKNDDISKIKEIENRLFYFSGERTGLLKLSFEYHDDDKTVLLNVHDVYQAIRENCFIHPITGEEDRDYKNNIIIIFNQTKKLAGLVEDYEPKK